MLGLCFAMHLWGMMAFVGVRIGLPLVSMDDSLLDSEAAVGMVAFWFLCTPCFAVWLRSDTAPVVVVIGLPLTPTTSD